MKLLYLIFSFLLALQLNAQSDIIPTNDGDLKLTPILHATLVLEWKDKTIYIDPYGGADRFDGFANADLILITHVHGDHLNKKTLSALDLSSTDLIAPQSVIDQLGELKFKQIHALKNGTSLTLHGITTSAIPMYNLPETADSRHPKGKGNGYVLTIGGKQFYISGDTEDIPEMRQLKNIDYAFVCMNLPYTMDVEAAASAVLDFKPSVIYPFHYRGGGGKFSDVNQFKAIVNKENADIEVRLRNWYPEK